MEESSQESFTILKDLLRKEIDRENLISQYQKPSDMIVCPTLACVKDLKCVEELARKEIGK